MNLSQIWNDGVPYALLLLVLLDLYVSYEFLRELGCNIVQEWRNANYGKSLSNVAVGVVLLLLTILVMVITSMFWPVSVPCMIRKAYRFYRDHRVQQSQ